MNNEHYKLAERLAIMAQEEGIDDVQEGIAWIENNHRDMIVDHMKNEPDAARIIYDKFDLSHAVRLHDEQHDWEDVTADILFRAFMDDQSQIECALDDQFAAEPDDHAGWI